MSIVAVAIENTPEHIRRARRTVPVPKESPKEECPRLVLAPFSRPPQVVFDNVLVGSTCERTLEIFNPSKNIQQITLGKSLPLGLDIQLPSEWILLEPETCYCVTMSWTPTQPTATRETVRFTNENRGRYDVIVVLKSVLSIKGRSTLTKGFKISPGKVKKKVGKKSPVSIYKKKCEIIYNTTQIKKTYTEIQSKQRFSQVYNKENMSINDNTFDSRPDKCPFDSPSSIDFHFDTSEVFSNLRKPDLLQQTYDKSITTNNLLNVPHNILKPSNKQTCDVSATEIFDNLTFTPLKTKTEKTEKLDKGPRIILSMNSESELDDSLDIKNTDEKENQTHSIISITSFQPPNKWLTVNHHTQYESHVETPNVVPKKQPNTSSPKELNSPNFSINTEFSRISDLSFFPQRFSTERKYFPKLNNETHELLDDPIKLSSDTYTKDSPNTPMEPNFNIAHETRPPHFFMKDQPKMCRQALFREYQYQREAFDQKSLLSPYEHHVWQSDFRVDARSPPRSITPPLQSIPEESAQFSDIQVLDKTDRHRNTFTINRTFDKSTDHFTATHSNSRQSWSKKAVRAEPDLWKIPITHVKKSVKNKPTTKNKDCSDGQTSNTTFEANKSNIQNMTVNKIGNVYSQSSTVDPFVSSTYFYDEEAVEKFESEFKRWLNCILTPPADLDSNIEQKIDVGKAWIENRNKEVPFAPTKEQVSSLYHNSHRLVSLRRSARALLMSPEISLVFQKLTMQIEKKLIAIRTDRNLHLDVGLQKIIMELLLSYNPLWLRIGLEAIYGLILPLKSNSDIEGLTTFIIQRMFKNPFLKNKHSKISAPNMLLPAYMEAIKKFTLKKFFMLVYFLDQAKQRKLISHDPCLFCRNAICKESREIIIRFTREVIAGIGDITKHLRPLGYVVSHKQSYLDEYKYAVHNIALDIRDGVRLVKVMEIILIKEGLLSQLRTPAISRLQKIHNVQVALNALKESNFVIHGDITATDIADGHREKTLSLLWQIIHVFRAPLFEKAANIIQTWWRKKYEVIFEKKTEAAKVIQKRFRFIREGRKIQISYQNLRKSVIFVQRRYRENKIARVNRRNEAARKIQNWYVATRKRNECRQNFIKIKQTVTMIQSIVRMHIVRKRFIIVRNATLCIQRFYRSYKITTIERQKYLKTRDYIIKLQSYIRRFIARTRYCKMLAAVKTIQAVYRAKRQWKLLQKLRMEAAICLQKYTRRYIVRSQYLQYLEKVRYVQTTWRQKVHTRSVRGKFLQTRKLVIKCQSIVRGYLARKHIHVRNEAARKIQEWYKATKKRNDCVHEFKTLKKTVTVIQSIIRMTIVRKRFIRIRKATLYIQTYWRSYRLMKIERQKYIQIRYSVTKLQSYTKTFIERKRYCKLLSAVRTIQATYRFKRHMRLLQQRRTEAAICLQKYVRQYVTRLRFLEYKERVLYVQRIWRAKLLTRQLRILNQNKAACKIQQWYIATKKRNSCRQEFLALRKTVTIIQSLVRMHIVRKRFVIVRNATLYIQRYYRSYKLMTIERQFYLKKKQSIIKLQSYVRAYIQRKRFRKLVSAAIKVQAAYRDKRQRKLIRQRNTDAAVCLQKYARRYLARSRYLQSYQKIVLIQKQWRAKLLTRQLRILKQNVAACKIQHWYRATKKRDTCRQEFLTLKKTVIYIQSKARMCMVRNRYVITRNAALCIQRFYRSYKLTTFERQKYLKTKFYVIKLQSYIRRFIARKCFCKLRSCVIIIQAAYRAKLQRQREQKRRTEAAICLQKYTKRFIVRARYLQYLQKVLYVQRTWRGKLLTRHIQNLKQNEAASQIQQWYRAIKKRDICRQDFLLLKKTVTFIQSLVRMRIVRKKFVITRSAILCIQRYYHAYKIAMVQRENYLHIRYCIIKVQSFIRSFIARKRYNKLRSVVVRLQRAFKAKKEMKAMQQRKITAVICLQKYTRRYIVRSQHKKRIIIKFQSILRGYLVRKYIQAKKEVILKEKEEQKRNVAASKIQALCRGHLARKSMAHDKRVSELRHRWRDGGLKSNQESMKERNEEAMEVLRNISGIETVIKAFRSLELLTEVFPMLYNDNASAIVHRVYTYMSVTNRSISSIEVLKSAAAVLVNLTRYKVTGPKIYLRDRIPPILKFMWRFSNSETQLFSIMATYLWLFSKYENIKKDLTELLKIPDNHRMLLTIKGNVDRSKRMSTNVMKNKFHTPQTSKFVSKNQSMNRSVCSVGNVDIVLPALEPDYGIVRIDKPRYFEDAQEAINCLFLTYKL
ncbi:unnamed protein product [Arctia plantaginis]|uniref:Calponin-homology (CH) domain-containing protein n=1 Tax=Arctia plantaginis TaxID=874455 RepID=A0A8S0YVR5_ARCPL|nr:unnamed protein product [Arctia plantaginis]